MKSTKNWSVGVFKSLDMMKWLDREFVCQRRRSKQYAIFRRPFCVYLMDGQKVFKIHDFLFLVTSNNIYQLQRNGSCIRMSQGCVWVGKIRPRILSECHKSLYIERETNIVPEGFEPEYFPLKYQHPTFKYKIYSVEVDLYYLK